METLSQIVIQLNTAPYERAMGQYGDGFIINNQIEIPYSDLTPEEKVTWDAFVEMIRTKQ